MKTKRNNLLQVFILMLVFAFTISSSTIAASMKLMTNLAGNPEYNTAFVWKNIMKNSRHWTAGVPNGNWPHGIAVDLVMPKDADWYPLSAPFNDGASVPCTLLALEIPTSVFPFGTFTLSFYGKGEIELRTLDTKAGNAEVSLAKITGTGGANPTVYQFNLTTANFKSAGADMTKGLFLRINTSDAADHIHDIDVVMPDPSGNPTYFENYKDLPFNPLNLKDLIPFSTVRYMDWVYTNHSKQITWANRASANRYTYAGNKYLVDDYAAGVPWEEIIKFSNYTHTNPWICIPAKADDNYILQLATLFRDNLDPSLNVYVEYSNEIWNGGFMQNGDVGAIGEAMGWGTANDFQTKMKAQAYRSGVIFSTFNTVFGTQKSRVIKVIAGQAASTGVCTAVIGYMNNLTYNPSGVKPDFAAIAPYLSGETTSAMNSSISTSKGRITSHQSSCSPVKVICYEGGQHMITGNIMGVNGSAGMYDVYKSMLDAFSTTGVEAFNNFTLTGKWTTAGAWGTKQYSGESLATAHKYRALIDWGVTNNGLDTVVPSAPSGLSASAVTGTSFNLSWNASTDNKYIRMYEVFNGNKYVGTTNSTTRTIAVTGLTANTTYNMRVMATDSTGNKSAYSVALPVLTGIPSNNPVISSPALGTTFVPLQSVTVNGSGANLSWKVSSIAAGTIKTGTGSSITFNVPILAANNTKIKVELTGGTAGDETVFNEYTVIDDAPVITSSLSYSTMVNQAINLFQAATGNGTPFTWSSTTTPSGVNLSSGGLLSGSLATSGTRNFTITVTDSDGDSDSETFSLEITDTPLCTPGAFLEAGGEVVMEAENYFSTSLNGDLANAGWIKSTSFGSFSGTGYMGMPDANLANANWATSSDLSYKIEFKTIGTYSVWLRRYSPDGDSDSGNVGLDGVQLGGSISNGSTSGAWGWDKHATTFNVTGPSVKTFNIRRREDGYSVDKIIITTNTTTPTGNGPIESNICSSIKSTTNNPILNVYPNPANNTIRISNPSLCDQIIIYDVLSREQVNAKVNGEGQIDISSLSANIYMVRLLKDGKVVDTQKLIKR